jgi:GTPase Era involved in 16S rRNA processing
VLLQAQEQRSKLDERMMAAVVSSIKAAEVIIAVVDSGEQQQQHFELGLKVLCVFLQAAVTRHACCRTRQ